MPLVEQDDRRRLYRPQGQGRLLPPQPRGGGKLKEAIDLATGDYRRPIKAAPRPRRAPSGDLQALLAHRRQAGRLRLGACSADAGLCRGARPARPPTTIVAIDEAMRLGYNWKYGPFELIDQLGAGWLAERLAAEGKPVPDAAATRGRSHLLRVEDGKRQYLGSTAPITTSSAPEGVLHAGGHQARAPSRCSRTARRRCGTSATASPASNSPAR